MPELRERPIIFSGPMVRAIIAGTKTQTRRVIPVQPRSFGEPRWWLPFGEDGPRPPSEDAYRAEALKRCRYGVPGDRLWVREAWQDYCPIWKGYWCGHGDKEAMASDHRPVYRADPPENWLRDCGGEQPVAPKKWRPSIHMPRWASRLTLELTEVRVQRLQEISEEDAQAEGVERDRHGWRDYLCPGDIPQTTAADSFCTLWESINSARAPWASDPWVWAVTFRRLDTASSSSRPAHAANPGGEHDASGAAAGENEEGR